jgi:hypothetical protein
MLKNILIGLGVIVAIVVAVIAIQPANFAIERSTEIAASPDVIFPHLDGAKALDVWSPWNKMDPQLSITHAGPERGAGSSESWQGPKMGVGSLTVTNVKPNEEVDLELNFEKPMKATNRALFTLAPAGTLTQVTWRMEGTNNFLGKAASLVMNMDRMVGDTFDRGLADLKTLAEADAQKQASDEAASAQATMSFDEMKAALGEPPDEPDAMSGDEEPAPPADE